MNNNEDAPSVEITLEDVSIGSEGRVEIINVRLAEMIKEAINLQKEQVGATGRGTYANMATCMVNAYQCSRPGER